MDKLKQLIVQLDEVSHDLFDWGVDAGVDAVLTQQGPILIGDARFSVPFSEARYRCLINRLGVLVLELTSVGEIIYSNEATSIITGIPTEQLLGKNGLEIIKPLSNAMSVDRLRSEFLENIELVDYETSISTVDGDFKAISWNTFDIFNGDQQLERIVYFGIDITQQQLLERKVEIAAIAFDCNKAMVICDEKGHILQVNSAYINCTGYSSKDAIGEHCISMLASNRHSSDYYSDIIKVLNEQGSWSGEQWIKRKNGEVFLALRTINTVRNSLNILTHYVGTIEDITEYKINEENLSIATTAFDSAQGMLVTDPNGLFIQVNKAFMESTGYSEKELIGQNANILKSGVHDAAFYEDLWQSLTRSGAWSGEIWNKKKTGELYCEWMNIVSVNDGNNINTHYLATFTDMSKLKAYENGLIEAKEKAERFSTLKSQFMASMSHEIRTPMAAIIGFSELAMYEDMSNEAKIYLQDINTASTSLLHILQDILDFTKLEVGRIVIESKAFNLLDLLDSINRLFTGAAQQKDLIFSIERDNAIPVELIGDKFRLQQVLTNLVGNAIKFTPDGRVKLQITMNSISLSQVSLLFNVIDTGIGIAPDDQDKLFQAFSQVDGSHNRKYGGTGLGLVISKELVELMGGEIIVDSHYGQGSSFSFAIQFAINKASIGCTTQFVAVTPELPNSLNSTRFKGRRVVLVEDNELLQKLIVKHLQSLGIETKVALQGQEALAMLEEHEVDAVLMDIHMPIMNGLEATQRIHQQPKHANLPIIALSAGVTETERSNCIASGMVGFVAKPIDIEHLYAVLELWLKPNELELIEQ